MSWEADGAAGAPTGGAGVWDASLLRWNNAGVIQAWSNVAGDTALFGGNAGTVTLGSAVTAGGLTFDVGGYTVAGAGNTLTLNGISPAVTVTNAGTLATIQANVALGANAMFGGAGDLAFNTGVVSGSGFGFSKMGTGTLSLAGANTFSGPVVLRAGTASISAANNLGDGSATNTLTLAGGALQATVTFNLGTNRGPIVGQGDGIIAVTGTNALTVDGTLSLAAGLTGGVILTKTDTGTLTLTGTNNTAAVGTTVTGGTVSIGSNANLGSGRVTLNGGTLQATGSTTITNGLVLGRSGGAVDVASGVTFQVAGAGVFGSGSLTKTGAGTLQINTASTFAGSTTINQGTLSGGVASFLPARTQLTIASGATLNMNGFATTVDSLSGAGTVTDTAGAALLTLGNQLGSVDSTFSGIFNSTTAVNLTVTKNGGGTLTLTNSGTPGTATGAWTFAGGTVNLDYSNAGSQTGNIINGSIAPTFAGGTLKLTGRSGATVAQALGNVTLNAGGSEIFMVPNGGTSTMLTLGTVPVSGATSSTAGGSLLVSAPAGTAVRVTTTDVTNGTYGGRIVFTDGSAYDWAANGGGSSPRTLTAYSGYTSLVASGSTASVNYLQTDTLSGGITASQTVNSLKITTTTTGQNLDLNGNALTLANGGLLFTGAQDFEILTTGGLGTLKSGTGTNSDFIVQQYGTGTLTISAPIVANTGTSTLTKAGTGKLVLNATNTYTGGTFINGGTLSISNNAALGAAATATITISDGAALQTTADVNTGTHAFTLLGGNATFDVANATTLTVGGVITGPGGLSLTNTGTLVLAAAATYTGPTFVGAGATLKGGVSSFINATAGGTLTVAAGGTVDINNFTLNVGSIAGSGTITNSGATATTLSLGSTTSTSSTNQDSTFSGTLSGALNLSKNGGGTLTLTSPATYTGSSSIVNGGLIFGVNNALPATSLTLANNAGPTAAFLDLNGFNWTSNSITFYGTSGGLTSQASINIGAGSVLTLGGTVTFANNTTAANSALPAFITGGTIELSASRSFAIADSPNAAVDLTVTSVIASTAGAFGITKTGAGTLLLTGANTYTGTTTLNGAGGTLLLGGAGTLGAGTGALTMTTGTLDLNGTSQSVGALTGAAAGTIRNGAAGTTSTLNMGNGSSTAGIYAGTIVDGGGTLALVKSGPGSVALTGANTYTGGTQVNEGVLTYGTTASQPVTGTTQVASTGGLGLGVGGAGFFSSADVDALFANTLAGVNMAAGASVGIDTAAGDFTYATDQSAARGLVKLGANVLTLTGNNTYTGGTRVVGGVLAVASDGNLGAAAGTLELAGGTLRITGTGNPTSNRSTTVTAASTIEVVDPANTYTINGNLTFTGAFTKAGDGVLKLPGDITSNSSILVTGGVLQPSGTVVTGTGTTSVGTSAGTEGVLRLPTGADYSTTTISIGAAAGGFGALVINGGDFATTTASTSSGIAFGTSGFGSIVLSSGSLSTRRLESGIGTAATSIATLQVTGGTLTNSEFLLFRNTHWDFTVTGGTVLHNAASSNLALGYQGNADAYGAMTVAGGSVDNTGRTVSFGQSATSAALAKASLNLNAGTLTTNQILLSLNSASATTAYVNFNGGTLKAAAATTTFLGTTGSGGTSTITAYVNGPFGAFNGGAVIDSNGFDVTIPTPLVAPTGNGVSSIPLTSGGSGYFGVPFVEITGGGGTGASAYAVVDLDPASATYGQLQNIVLTNPGVGYTSAPTVNILGGGGTGATIGTVATMVNTSGGLTKIGAGTLTLTAVNTFTGDTIVNGGTLSIAPGALPNISGLKVGSAGNGSFNLYQDGVGAPWTMPANAGITLGGATSGGTLGFQLGTASDSIILSGTGGLAVNAGGGFIEATALSGFGVGSYDVITGASGITGFGNLQLGSLPGGYSYSLSNGGSKVTLNVAAIAPGDFYWTGSKSNSWATLAGGTNWSTTANGLTDPGYTPGTGNTVYFSATNAGAAPIVTTLDNTFSIPGLKFIGSGTGAVTIAPGTNGSLTIGSGGIEVQAGAAAGNTISAPLVLGAAQTWTLTGTNKTLDATGIISGGVGNSTQAAPGTNTTLTINGGGTVSITNSGNTFTGDIVVDGSTLIVANNGSWGGPTVISSTSHTITLQNGAKLSLATGTVNPGAATTTSYNLINIGAGGATLDTGATATLQLDDAGQLSGTGNITKTGDGLLLLGNAYTGYTGSTITVNGGELRLQNTQALGATGTQATIILAGGTTLRFRNNTSSNFGSAVTVNGDVTVIADRTSATTSGTHTAGPLTIGSSTMTIAHGANFNADSTGSVTFGAVTLTGSPTFLLNNVNGAGIGTLTLGAVDLGSNSITFDGPANASLPGIVSGGGSLVRQGGGTLTMGGVVNTFNGGLFIKAGVVSGGNNASTFGASTNVITLGDTSGSADATIKATNSFTYPQPFSIAGGNTGTASIIAGTSTGNVIFSGPVTLNNHDVLLGKTGTTGASQFTGGFTGTGNIVINNTATTGTLALATGLINNSGTITNTSTATGTTTISAQIGANVTNVTQNSTTSILSLSGSNPNFAGTVTVTSGTLQMGGASALNAANQVSIASGATFNLNGNNQTIAGLSGAGTANNSGSAKVLTLGGTGSYVFSGVITGTTPANTALTVAMKGGSQTLTGQSLYTGATTVNQGTLILDFDASSLASNILSASSPLVMGGGTLSVIGDAQASSQTFASSTLTTGTYSVISAAAGAGGLVLDGGTLTRNLNSGLNVNMSGSPDVRLAGVSVANGLAVGSNGAAFMTINGTDWGTVTGSNPTAFTGYVNDTFTGATDNVNVTTSGTWTGGTVNTLRLNAGSPALTLSGRSMLNAGGLLVGSGAGSVTVDGTGTLAGSAVTGTVGAPVAGELGIFQNSASAMVISAAIVNNSSSLSHVTATPSGTALNKYGIGTLILASSRNAYSGGTNIAGGILRLGVAEALPDGTATPGAVTIASGAALDLNGFSETINGLAGTGTVNNTSATAATLYVGNTNATSTFSGVLQSSSLALTKIGTGILTLSGANTYTGATTISAGGLTLNFTLAGAPLSNIVSSSSALELGSSTLSVTGSTTVNSQTFNGTLLSGGSRVTLSGTTPALTVNLGAISRTGLSGASGSINVTLVSPGVVTTTNSNDASGILGGWAVVNSADFATVSGGNIVAYTGYTAVAAGTGAGNAAQNALFNTGNSVDTATVDFNTVKLGTSIGFAATGNILRLGATGAILMPTGLAAANIGATAGSGVITAGGAPNTAGELNLINWSSNALTVNSAINNNGTGVVTLVKSGTGGLTLATTNGFTGGIIINGGTVTATTTGQLSTGPITLNGGGLTFSADSSLSTTPFVLGPAGGTLTFHSGFTTTRNYGAVGDLGMVGSGARTLTLAGGTDVRIANLQSNVIDGSGGTTSLVMGLSGDNRVLRLSGVNTYTGTTLLTRGVLDFTAVAAIPGGITSAATLGNIIFGATGTNRTVLQSSVATPTAFTRSVGYGDGQIHWEGNGGFSNNIANTAWAINLGGLGDTLVWGSGGFVPTGSILQFGATSITNSVTNLGAVDFQNDIDLGAAVRTIDTASANDKQGSTPYDVILSGDLISSAGGGINKTGTGVMILSGTNNTSSTTTVNVTTGAMIFSTLNAIPGSGANLTLSTTVTGDSAIGVTGDTDPLTTLGARIANPLTATSAFALGADSSVDFNFTNYPNMRLAAFAFPLPAKALNYTGTITPAGSTYRFGGVASAGDAVNGIAFTLVLPKTNALTGANALSMSYGNLTLLGTNNYTGGTILDGSTVGTSLIGIGSNAALGTDTVTLAGSQTKAFGAVNGDRYLSNNIAWAGSGTSWVAGADAANDGVASTTNGGGMTYLGTISITNSSTTPTIVSRTGHQVLLLGDITKVSGTSTTLIYSASTAGLLSALTTSANGGVPKTYTLNTTLNATTTLVIDSDASFGASTGTLSLGNSGSAGNTATLRLQPGTGAVTLNASRSVAIAADRNDEIRIGAGGTLTIAGVVGAQGTNTGTRNIIKTDQGTLVFTNKNAFTGAATFTPGLAIRGGAIQLDSSAGTFTGATDRFFPDASNALPLAFSVATGTFGGGGTLEIIQAAGNAFALTQGFGIPTFNTGANVIKLTNNSATQGLTLNFASTFTRTNLLGGTLNFVTSSAGGTTTIGSAVANTNGILGVYATFNGLDWATQSGGSIIALPSGSYTTNLPGSGSTATANYVDSQTAVTVTASESINTLKLTPTASNQTITINAGIVLRNTSNGTGTPLGIIFDNTNGSSTITSTSSGTGTGQLNTTGAELVIHTYGSGDPTTKKLTLAGVLKGSATVVTKTGPGTLVLAGTNTYTGSLIINAGTVEYANGSASSQNLGSPTAGASNILLNGGTLRQTATNNLIYGITVNGYSKLDVPTGVTMNQTAQGITGKVGVTGILQKTGPGTLTFSGTSDNAALSLDVANGTVNLGKTSSATVHSVGVAAGSSAASSMGASLLIGSGATVNITGSGGDQIHDQSSVVVRTGGVFNLGGGAATSEAFDGLAGDGSVTNTGLTGTFTLTLGAGNSVNISSYMLAAAEAGVAATGLNNFGGVISDGGAGKVVALTKTGSGIQILSGNNTYSGATSINAGTLQLGIANALPSGAGKGSVTLIGNGYGAATINGGTSIGTADKVLAPGTLDMGGFNQNINGLNSTTGGYVVNNPTLSYNGSAWVAAASTNTLTLGNGDASGSFNGTLMDGYTVAPGVAGAQAYLGTLSLTKTGLGTQILSGASTYTGGTLVSGGTLLVNNTLGSGTGFGALTSNLGSTLGGIGIIAPTGSNGVSIGGLLAPGTPAVNSGVGTLSFATFNGNVAFTSTATTDFQLLTNGTHGYTVTFDATGNIDTITGTYLGGGNDRILFNSTGTGQLDFSALAANSLGVSFAAGYTPALHDVFDLFDWTSIQGLNASQLNLPSLASFDPTWSWDTSKLLSYGVIGIVAVPEPSRVLLLLSGLVALARRRRR